jgi:hypothetical protein
MKAQIARNLLVLLTISGLFIACQKEESVMDKNSNKTSDLQLKNGNGFIHGIVIELDGEDYYFDGPPDGPNGEKDVPGHYWRKAGKDKVNAKHYNSGPFDVSSWWSSGADDGDYLYFVHGIIDMWTAELAEEYAADGFVHYHEFVSVSTGLHHPTKVIWLKHTAVTSFTLDGGPGAPNPPYQHMVTPGIDWEFPNNYMMPYAP